MKDQAMRMYDARNVLADRPGGRSIQIYEPHLVKGRMLFWFVEVTRDRAVEYARLLWRGQALKALPESLRADYINSRFIAGTEISMEEMRRRS